MKKIVIAFLLNAGCYFSYGQNTSWPGPSDNSNVGIGTSNPKGLLALKGISTDGLLRLTPTIDNNEASISFNTFASESDISNNWVIGTGSWGLKKLFVLGNNAVGGSVFVVNTNGNLLIGQTSQANSTYKLDVKGRMRADAITVNTSGADFVFSPSYKLRPLSSVQNYITKNHHLPEIASAKEMSEEGMEVGEMNKKLLQKVEELTLYLIEKDKEIKKLKQTEDFKIDKLKKQIKYLYKK